MIDTVDVKLYTCYYVYGHVSFRLPVSQTALMFLRLELDIIWFSISL